MFLDHKQFRLPGYDYSQPGFYFVTINTKNKELFFGKVIDGKMILSEFGLIAEKYWLEIAEHFSMVRLWEFVVMPNHIHGIIQIVDPNPDPVGTGHCPAPTFNIQ